MRVLQIPNYQYPHIGGIEQVARDIADTLSERKDIEQKIICFNEDAQNGSFICHREETVHDCINGVEVIRCGCIAKIASQSISLTYRKELVNVISRFKPDIVILHYPNPFVSSFLYPLLSQNRNIKFVLYWHLDITKQRVLGKMFHGQNIKLLKRANRIVATSPNYIHGSPYLSKYKEKCVAIPNCIRTERLQITEKVQEIAELIRKRYGNKTICFAIGRHVEYKGMKYLVEASKHLDDNYAVLIGGKGPLTDSLKKQAETDDKVEFLGRISDEELVAYYLACDIITFPSITKNEAFGLALAEGMYFGKPAVTFTIPGSGVNYVSVNGETGIECKNGDTKEYASAIRLLGEKPELRRIYGENAKKRVIDTFMFEQFKKNILSMVDDVK